MWSYRQVISSKGRNFFFGPSGFSLEVLSVLRITISTLLIFEAAILSRYLYDFYSSQGIISPILNDIFSMKPILPKFSWFLSPLMSLGMTEMAGLQMIYAFYLSCLFFLLVGWRTKFVAAIACFLHILIYTSGYYSSYGVDRYTHFILFYFILVPCSEVFSIDSLKSKEKINSKKAFATFCLRVIQIHLLITYTTSGMEKATGGDWIQGEAVWRALMLPGF